MAMMPKKAIEADPQLMQEKQPDLPPKDTLAQKLDDSRLLAWLLLAMGGVYLFAYFSSKGLALSLNIVIGLFLFTGLLAHGTPERYSRAVEESARGISGIVLLFPFYGGIMGLMTGSVDGGVSLGAMITRLGMCFKYEMSNTPW